MRSGIAAAWFAVLVLPELTSTITTTHHDGRPANRRPSTFAINITVPPTERQKRLLPYYNFYLAQDINRPIVTIGRYKNPQHQQQRRPVQFKPQFTPFLESNALSGPFVPIQKQQQNAYGTSEQYETGDDKVLNYGAIYDKLSQLKLAQQSIQRPQQSYNQIYRIIPQQRKPPNADHNSAKTVIQTYTPAEIEIPPQDIYISTVKPYTYNHDDDKLLYQNPDQIQRPIVYIQNDLPVTTAYYEKIQFKPTPVTILERPYTQDTTRNSLDVLLKKLQASNTLPQTFTTENIDNSIKTLVKILGNLKKQQTFTKPIVVAEEGDYVEDGSNEAGLEKDDVSVQMFPPDTDEGGTPGKAGVDYPALSSIPQTSFDCKTQRYKGFFGDPDTNCQVWHYCDLNGGQSSFLCPNGTIFSQVALTCDWWFNVKCSTTAQLYVLNERLYKYILPFSPKFPEDYSGPLVDKYLALKFQEMEEKMKKQKKGKEQNKVEETKEVTTVDPNYITKLEDADAGR